MILLSAQAKSLMATVDDSAGIRADRDLFDLKCWLVAPEWLRVEIQTGLRQRGAAIDAAGQIFFQPL